MDKSLLSSCQSFLAIFSVLAPRSEHVRTGAVIILIQHTCGYWGLPSNVPHKEFRWTSTRTMKYGDHCMLTLIERSLLRAFTVL